jgi:hypothetical protein
MLRFDKAAIDRYNERVAHRHPGRRSGGTTAQTGGQPAGGQTDDPGSPRHPFGAF